MMERHGYIITETEMSFRTRPAHIFRRLADAELITVYRPGTGARNSWGEWVAGAAATTEQLASTIPVERERAVGEDGARLLAERRFWSTLALYARDEDRDGDLVRYDDQWWRITGVERFPSHFEAMAVRIEGQTPGSSTPPDDINAGSSNAERMVRRLVAIALGNQYYSLDSGGTMFESLNVIPAFGPGPTPVGRFATVFLANVEQVGEPNERMVEDTAGGVHDTLIQTSGNMRGEWQVDIYREGAAVEARRLLVWLQGEQAKLAEQRLEMYIQRNPPIRMERTDGLVGSRYEERATLTFTADWLEGIEENAGRVDDVSIELCEDDSGFNETIRVQN